MWHDPVSRTTLRTIVISVLNVVFYELYNSKRPGGASMHRVSPIGSTGNMEISSSRKFVKTVEPERLSRASCVEKLLNAGLFSGEPI